MTNMFTVYLKEIKSYYSSPVACIFSGLFLLVSAILFCINNLFMESSNFNNTLASMGVVLIFIIPVLTMRILSEERKNGTEALLLTSPISLASIVVGKYLAALTVFLIFTIISFIFPLSLLAFGGKITAQLLGGYAGFIFLGAAYISIGVFASSLTKNQIISACLSFVILLIIWISSSFANVVGGGVSRILKWLSLISRYESFNLGLFKIEHLVYYLSFIILFITLTVMVIEKRRWS